MCVARRADRLQRLLDCSPFSGRCWTKSPFVADEPEQHQVVPAHRQILGQTTTLRYITDSRIAATRWTTQHADAAAVNRQLTEQDAQQAGLAGAVRTNQSDELTGVNFERG